MSFDPNAAAAPGSGIFGLPNTPESAKVVVIPVPFEATCSYGGGTANGPAAILKASKQVDLYDVETGRPYAGGIAMVAEPAQVRGFNDEAKKLAAPVLAQGGAAAGAASVEKVNALCDQMNAWVYAECQKWLGQDKLVATLGGDHSVSFGAIKAHAEKYPGMGILHLDAHADLRQAYEGFTWSHASIMYNVVDQLPGVRRLVQVAIRDLSEAESELIEGSEDRIVAFHDSDLAHHRNEGTPWNRMVDQIVAELPREVYLSFDIDGLDPSLCPGTGTPVPGGISFHEAVALVAGVTRSGRKIVGLDLTEVGPGKGDSDWDGNVGARLLYKMIGHTLRSQA